MKEMNGFGAQVPEGTYYFMCSLEKFKNEVYNSTNNAELLNFSGYFKDTYFGMDVFLSSLVENAKIDFFSQYNLTIHNDRVFLYVSKGYEKPFDVMKRYCYVTIFGDKEEVERIYRKLKASSIEDVATPDVNWWYRDSDNSIKSSKFKLAANQTFNPNYYPFIKDLDDYITKFNESNSNVLILLGPPGTGKSSFIKYMLNYLKKDSITTYDASVMQDDQLYVKFIDSACDYLVLEDADILLTTRDKDDNRVMHKILNASEGIIATNRKKFIFTANFMNETRIDEALTRKGRCYDVIHFRPLYKNEAEVVAESLGKTLPDQDEFTLAEIFNGVSNKKAKIGF